MANNQNTNALNNSISRVTFTAVALAASTCIPAQNANVTSVSKCSTTQLPANIYSFNPYVVEEREKRNNKNTAISFKNNDLKPISPTNNWFRVLPKFAVVDDLYYENLTRFMTCIDEELKQYSNRIIASPDMVKKIAYQTSTKIAELKAEKSILELCPNNTLKFTLIFSGNRTLMINKPIIVPVGFPESDIIFSFFHDDDLLSADTNNLDDFIVGFKEYLAA